MSYIERTARKLYPILQELKKRMIPEKQRKRTDSVTGIDFQSSDGEMIIDLT